jgi:hypothetical protein
MMPYVLPGTLLCFAGFSLFFFLLVKHGGIAKSKQLGVIGSILGGEKGAGARRLLVLAFLLLFLGACAAFTGVAIFDQRSSF